MADKKITALAAATSTTTADVAHLVTGVATNPTKGVIANQIANGIQSQLKVIVFITDGGTATLTPATMNDGTTLAFADAGDAAMLMWIGAAGWAVISQAGTGTPGAGPTIG